MLLLVVSGGASAQIARVSGIVRDVNGQPIRSAIVTADSGAGSTTSTTDEEGRFSILGVRAGRWKLEVQAPGYLSETGEIVVRAVGAPNQPITIALRRTGVGIAGPLSNVPAAGLQEQLTAADALFDQQKWDEAIAAYRAILTRAPSLGVINLQIAAAHRQRKDYDAAIGAYQDLLKIDPANDKAQAGIGMTNVDRGDVQSGEQALLKAATGPAPGRYVLYGLGELEMSRGRTPQAADWYRKAAGVDPSWGKPLYRLGELAISARDEGSAVKYLGEVIAVDPASPEAELARAALDRLKK
jgi:predicted Zn-dependent protease